MKTLAEAVRQYADTPEAHYRMYSEFTKLVNADSDLSTHRLWVEANGHGYGEPAFHWLWKLLFNEMPAGGKFLEIGVFKGQTISLMSQLAKRAKKNIKVYGVTPLARDGDKYALHPDEDYLACIRRIYSRFDLPSPTLIALASFDPRAQKLAAEHGPYDVVYIDGCHDYEVVLDDIIEYGKLVKDGGYLVLDDAATYLDLPENLMPTNFKGLEDVSNAVRDTLETNKTWAHAMSVGHLRLFRKLSTGKQ